MQTRKLGANRSQVLRDSIEQDIVTGTFEAGEQLHEISLAKRYGVSRTPIREALHQLAAAGIVEIRPHRGAFVTEVSSVAMIEMFEAMAEIEGVCAKLAARRITPDRLANLFTSHADCEKAAESKDADRYYYANETFHNCIYEATGNRFLEQQAKSLQTKLKPFRRLQLRAPDRMESSLKEHQAIIDAVVSGDGEAAQRAMSSHILVQINQFHRYVSTLE